VRLTRFGSLLGVVLLALVRTPASARNDSSTVSTLEQAERLLETTESGRQVLEAAREGRITWVLGQVSRTEVTATRTVHDEVETVHYDTRVIISGSKSPVFQALDLAHELVHALRPKENPFHPALKPGDYVVRGIEGEGGEAEAIAYECRVGREWIDRSKSRVIPEEDLALVRARCGMVWKAMADGEKWKRSFYYLGQHYRDFLDRLTRLEPGSAEMKRWKERLDPRTPIFSSAMAQKPYPLALLEEYLELTRKICSRSPASESPFSKRCGTLERVK
jgi:hypothetical protein